MPRFLPSRHHFGCAIAVAAALAALVAACSGSGLRSPAPARPTFVASSPDPNRKPSLRLSNATVPTAYKLRLKLDPDATNFSGDVIIDILVQEPVHTLWLHSKGLQILSAEVEQLGTVMPLRETPKSQDSELLGLSVDTKLAVGPARLHLRWRGHFGSKTGIFRQTVSGRHYVYSDFEATDARAAFP